MVAKQAPGATAPDSSLYVTVTDGAGNLGGATGGSVTVANAAGASAVNIQDGGNSITVDGTVTTTPPANASTNVTQINSVTPLMGNGVTGTGALRVSIASDSTGIVALPAAGTSVVGTKAAGTAAATSMLTGSVYNSTVPVLTDGQQIAHQADTTGAKYINNESRKATYSASNSFTLAASATDIFAITGSASKTVRINRVQISGNATSAVNIPVTLVKRSTANTGGTTGAPSVVPHDSTNAAATATVVNYTANPTTGTPVGNLRSQLCNFVPGTGSATSMIQEFGTRNDQAVVLRGTSQVLAINLGGATVTGGGVSIDIEWTEE